MNDLSRIFDMWKRYLEIKGCNDYLTLYVHIPFCTSKCNFCMYRSYVFKNTAQLDEQIEKLERDMIRFSPIFKGHNIKALYIGGGTPSLMTIDQMKRLFGVIQSNFKLDIKNDNMFSIELHPASTDEEKVNFIYSSFINRVSMGVQSFDEDLLRGTNRAHVSLERTQYIIRYLLKKFKEKGGRVNVDMMIGLKGEVAEKIKKDLKVLMDTGLPIITIYAHRHKRTKDAQAGFEKYCRDLLKGLEKIDERYQLITDPENFKEDSFFVKKGYSGQFKKVYNTYAHFNSNVGFGKWAYSFITPLRFVYVYEQDRYIVVHDPEKKIYHETDRKLYELFFDRAEKLRAEGNEVVLTDI